MGNCLSSDSGRHQADKGTADRRRAKSRPRRSKRRPSLERNSPIEENLASSAYMTAATTTTTTTPNPLNSRVNLAAHPGAKAQQEASSNHHQQQNCEEEECEDDCPNPIAPPQNIVPDLDGQGTQIDSLFLSSTGRPQRVTQRALTLHQRSLALMKSAPPAPPTSQQPPSHGLMKPPSVFDSEDDYCQRRGSSTDDFSSLESERQSWDQVGQEDQIFIQPARWHQVGQEDQNTFERIATPSSKSERSNKSGSTNRSLRPVGNQTPRKSSLLVKFHARRRIENA